MEGMAKRVSRGLSVRPHFTEGQPAEKLISWKKTDAVIRDRAGQIHFELKGVTAPEEWSQLAIEIGASRYFRKVGRGGARKEKSIRDLVDRVLTALRRFAREQKIFATPGDLHVFIEELRYILLTQRAAFNSPVWFNAGVWDKYRIRSKNEQYAWDPKRKAVTLFENAYEKPQVSACFIQSIEDSIEGIFELAKTEARLFKYGSGTGTNFSALRSRYEELHSGGTSSGLISFLEVLDRGAGAIKSGGTTRRAAKMVVVDIDHPEVPEFIDWKKNEEQKARALIAAGWSADFEGPAYKTVGGQNANNSVRVTDKFMKAVEAGAEWPLRSRTDKKVIRTYKAAELWRKIAVSAWTCADPGLQFHDTINRWHTCPKGGAIRGSNPCSEYMFLDDSACNLASLNLVKFFDDDGRFDVESYLHTVRLIFLAQEIFVDGASYPTELIARKSHDYRPLGLGFANLGSLLMRLGVGYDSAQGRAWAGALTSLMSSQAYAMSAEVAKLKGPFAGWAKNKKAMTGVVSRHARASNAMDWTLLPKGLGPRAKELWALVVAASKTTGLRNAQATVIAPTGTIGLLMDCDTTGIEPDFSLLKRKKLAGGGEVDIVNRSVEPALRKLGYAPDQIAKILEWVKTEGNLAGAPDLRADHRAVFACATGPGALSPEAHLEMMAAVQPFLSGAISKTVNLPSSATVEDIAEVHHRAWTMGLKSIAVYRDGSKGGQPLSATKTAPTENPFVKCPECGSPTELHSGCYRCPNCGFSVGCA